MHIFTTLTVAFLMVYASGCSCTEVGCSGGVAIGFNKTSGAWEPGKYVISIDGDGRKLSCSADLPLVNAPTCDNEIAMHIDVDAPDASASSYTIKDAQIDFSPTKLIISITRDGAEIAKTTFTPTYTKFEPNGELCGPTCLGAEETMTVP
jgi:hypothetical protein